MRIRDLLCAALAALAFLAASCDQGTTKEAPRSVPSPRVIERWCVPDSAHSCLPQICDTASRTIAVFHAEWCSWCRLLEETTMRDPRVKGALFPLAKVRIDIDADRGLASRYGVSGVPTIIFLDAHCVENGRIPGYVDPEELLEALEGLH